ncbi:DUF2267 domain-containing protein [Actinokineospora fastidiosa]|uniref:DUF2267 domain-containing protein n=1 Tax=Actinokineospora fastidiosa TaxID=1816 RepID=A0A918GCJ8_9PSEU|nr:DUF2267 domain-containing protein [Actinokineospora fastidiosa]GGS28621.1 hypothetical protein GCM10010171_22160 [Actinokineospora fastidiosa]
MTTRTVLFEQAGQAARRWVREISHGFPTDDEHFVFRVLRTWLHIVRDQLTVPAAAHLAAQLPDLLRGTYYEGWNPSRVPHRADVAAFVDRFAQDAGISPKDVPTAARVVTTRMDRLMSAGQIAKVLAQLPRDVRAVLDPAARIETEVI